jgi:hypothetical protein
MPPQSRAQRRRQAARQQQQRRPSPQRPNVEEASPPASTGPTLTLDSPATPVAAPAAPRQAARAPRRVLSRPAPEPVDYTKDYAAARRDLRWILIWTVLLFVAMIALKFSGLV